MEKKVIFNSVEIPQKSEKVETSGIILGYVGSLSQSKGIELLLTTFIKMNLENVKLFIYGKGVTNQYESYLKTTYENINIIFKGFQKANDIYKNIDILIVPSLWDEPFGRIVPEANSYDIPVIVSNRGGLPELVTNNKNGFIFDPDLDDDLENKLKLILNACSNQLFEYDLSLFSLEKTIGTYTNIYNNCDNEKK